MIKKVFISLVILLISFTAFADKEYILTNSGQVCLDYVFTASGCMGISHGQVLVCKSGTVCPKGQETYKPGKSIVFLHPKGLGALFTFIHGQGNNQQGYNSAIPYGAYDLNDN